MGVQEIQVGIKKPGFPIEIKTVTNELETFQALVEGYVEQVGLGQWIAHLALLCNEEGKLGKFQPNFGLGADIIVGTVVFVNLRGADNAEDADWHSLNAEQLEHLNYAFAV